MGQLSHIASSSTSLITFAQGDSVRANSTHLHTRWTLHFRDASCRTESSHSPAGRRCSRLLATTCTLHYHSPSHRLHRRRGAPHSARHPCPYAPHLAPCETYVYPSDASLRPSMSAHGAGGTLLRRPWHPAARTWPRPTAPASPQQRGPNPGTGPKMGK